MGCYRQCFEEMKVDGLLILELEESDLLQELYIQKKLHRKKILKGIQVLKDYNQFLILNKPNQKIEPSSGLNDMKEDVLTTQNDADNSSSDSS